MKFLVKKAFLSTLPVMAGYVVLGTGFGILLHANGYGIGWSAAMSIFIFAGSMQFLAVDLLSGGASLITTALTTLMVNARHLFYGISMIDKYKHTGWRKPYLIFSLTDETYSLNCTGAPEGVTDENTYFLLVSVLDHCYWVLGSLLGSALGAMLPLPTQGIEFSLTALFVTVFVEQWQQTRDHIPALTGLFSALLCLALFGPDRFLIPTMVLITAALGIYGKKGGARHV